MSVLATVFIALAAAFIGFIIGCIVGISCSDPVCPVSTEPNPIKTVNADLKPKEAVVLSKVVMPKRIKEPEYNKKVNAALKDAIDEAVDVWVSGNSKPYKRALANSLYHEWHVKLENVNYRNYNPKLQCLNIVGKRGWYGFKFEAFWNEKLPKNL